MYIVPQLKGDEKLVYLRKSQTDDPLLTVEEVLQKHEQMLAEWVETNQPEGGPVPPANIFREIGSGETIAARPQMQALLRMVESPKIRAIMVTEPSRLTRGDLEDIGYLVKILRYTNTLVITLGYTYDLTDARDRDNFERELMRGNEYLEYTKKIRWNGRLAAVKAGHYIGQTAPYGFRKTVIQDGRRKIHTLEPHPDEAPVVTRIFEMYADGLGGVKIADQLDIEHIPAPKGKVWSHATVKRMLDNYHYLGKVVWNNRPTVRTVEDGEVKLSRPFAEKPLIFDGLHPAIVDQELWDRVRDAKGHNARNRVDKNLFNPLAGIMWCANCGRSMSARTYNNKDGVERCAPRILCPGVGRQRCGNASARLQDVMADIGKVLEDAVEEFEVKLGAGIDDSADQHRRMIERMEKRLSDLRAREVQQWDEKMRNKMPEHVFRQLNDPLVAEIAELEKALQDAREQVPEPVNLKERIVTFRAALAALNDPDAPVKEKNQLLKACINRIEYKREKYTNHGGPKKATTDTPVHLDFTLKI